MKRIKGFIFIVSIVFNIFLWILIYTKYILPERKALKSFEKEVDSALSDSIYIFDLTKNYSYLVSQGNFVLKKGTEVVINKHFYVDGPNLVEREVEITLPVETQSYIIKSKDINWMFNIDSEVYNLFYEEHIIKLYHSIGWKKYRGLISGENLFTLVQLVEFISEHTYLSFVIDRDCHFMLSKNKWGNLHFIVYQSDKQKFEIYPDNLFNSRLREIQDMKNELWKNRKDLYRSRK